MEAAWPMDPRGTIAEDREEREHGRRTPLQRPSTACLALAASLLSAAIPTAQAAEQTLGYHLVVHVTDLQSLPVPGQPGHEVGIAAFDGIAIFDDGRLANHAYAGSFDFVGGEGTFRGYALWTFEDGSTLSSSYVGEAKATADGISLEGTHSDIAGTGAFEGASGQGHFTGSRIDHLNTGGDTHHRGTLTLTLPD